MAANGQVADEEELLASVLRVRLDLVVQPIRTLSRDHDDFAVELEIRTCQSDVAQGIADRRAVVVGVQIKVRLDEQFVLTAGRV